ncbi:MAG: hypothetical protein IT447_02970 [Phycisphaerales bacterium]|jgi:hypothetical protein|nr:hypothetical protein [Phycisphaerales bacterium]
MAAKSVPRIKQSVRYSKRLEPEDYFTFIHFDGFTDDWKYLRLDDDDLMALENQLMREPHKGSVIAGTGGLRKVRFSPPSWHRGKSGALRILYAIFPDFAVVVLAAAYAKSDQENISAQDKKMLKMIMQDIGRFWK